MQCTAERNREQDTSKVSGRVYDRLFMRHWDHWLDDRRSPPFALSLDEKGAVAGNPVRVSTVDADVPFRIWGGSEEYTISSDSQTVYFAARLRNGK